MAYRYPYGNTEQMNLDWFLNQWEKFKADWAKAEAGIDGSLDAEIAKVEAAMSELYAARDAAAASASAARQSSLDAAAAQVAAGNSKTAAQAAETAARDSQQAAAQSAQEAKASAQGAENSALTASQAANTATQQAAGAYAARGAAEAAQQAAEDAQAAAAQSAEQAGQEATAAADHADDAAESAKLAQQAAQDMSDSVEQITTNKNDISDLKESIDDINAENAYLNSILCEDFDVTRSGRHITKKGLTISSEFVSSNPAGVCAIITGDQVNIQNAQPSGTEIGIDNLIDINTFYKQNKAMPTLVFRINSTYAGTTASAIYAVYYHVEDEIITRLNIERLTASIMTKQVGINGTILEPPIDTTHFAIIVYYAGAGAASEVTFGLSMTNSGTQISRYANNYIAPDRLNINDFISINDILYKVTTQISTGGSLIVGTNIVQTTIADELTALLNN